MVLWIFIGVGVLLALLGIPLMRRRIAPNALYGFRTPTTLSRPTIWYEVNARCGRDLVALGVVVTLLSFLGFWPGASTWWIAIPTAAVLAGTIVITLRGFLLIRRLQH
jgi:uncharacterized membrane protein